MNTTNHVIDCDNPFVPQCWPGGWSIMEHRNAGQLVWNPLKVGLLPADGKVSRFRERLRSKVLNGNVYHFLLANPHLIPSEWKGKMIVFWGTVYADCWSDGLVASIDYREGSPKGLFSTFHEMYVGALERERSYTYGAVWLG